MCGSIAATRASCSRAFPIALSKRSVCCIPIQKPFLDQAFRMLKPGGELRLATDDPDYLIWMLQRVLIHPGFEWTARTADDWRLIPADAIETRYGIKSRLEGRPATFLKLRRRETAA